MNNEEKILSALETLTTTVTAIQSDIQELKQGQAELREDVDLVRRSVVVIENEHGKMLGAIYDGYLDHQRKIEHIEPLENKVDEHEIRIWTLEEAVKTK